jgi:MMP endo-(1,4)-3-O-methyl-alpha-D-mannosidase
VPPDATATGPLSVPGILTASDIRLTVDTIAEVQQHDGCIPWFKGGHADPWDHIEAAMALSIGDRRHEAERAYEWLVSVQRASGSWAFYYRDGVITDATRDANFTAYVATGVWHHFLITDDDAFLETMWPTVERAIDFVLDLQAAGGEIIWSRDSSGAPGAFALLTSSSSIHLSLRCAIAAAERLGHERPDWELSLGTLAHAVAHRPDAFEPKDRFSMDWYYPVLGGVLTGHAARTRLDERWATFVVPGRGARCVADQPWVTAAETCELVMALDACGRRADALRLYRWVQYLRDDDGSYWTGHNYVEDVHYPEGERTTWTAAAIVLAADALAGTGPTASLFRGEGLPAGLDPNLREEAGLPPTPPSGMPPSAANRPSSEASGVELPAKKPG